MPHPPKTAPSLKSVSEKKRSKTHSLLPAHLFVLSCKYHTRRTWRMSPRGKLKAHRADGGTGWAFLETRTRKDIHTKTNLSLSIELFSLLQGNAETERPHTSLRKDSAQCGLCVFIHIYVYSILIYMKILLHRKKRMWSAPPWRSKMMLKFQVSLVLEGWIILTGDLYNQA